jgi:hypothetical protein
VSIENVPKYGESQDHRRPTQEGTERHGTAGVTPKRQNQRELFTHALLIPHLSLDVVFMPR